MPTKNTMLNWIIFVWGIEDIWGGEPRNHGSVSMEDEGMGWMYLLLQNPTTTCRVGAAASEWLSETWELARPCAVSETMAELLDSTGLLDCY